MMTCEFNYSLTRSLIFDYPEDGKKLGSTCQNEATLRLGNKNAWHLCDKCAALPIFRRLRLRVRIAEERRAA